MQEYLTRQYDLIPASILDTKIEVVGVGAIGSITVLILAKMGFNNIHVYDFDKVDAVNINNQFYRIKDIDVLKVLALKEIVKDFTGIDITAHETEVKDAPLHGKFVISAVDSMSARAKILDLFMGEVLIDPRMAIEDACIRTLNLTKGDSYNSYAKSLYSDEEAVQERCTAKATMYTPSLIGGLIAKIILDVLLDRPYVKALDWDLKLNVCNTFVSK